MGNPNYYQMLGIARDADFFAIKAAYRNKAKSLHPDAGGDPEKFRILKLAHDVLSDGASRAAYDETLGQESEGVIADEQQLRLAVALLFRRVIGQVKDAQLQDVVLLMRAAAADQVRVLDEQLSAGRLTLDKMRIAYACIHHSDGANILQGIVKEQYVELNETIDHAAGEKALYESVLIFLEGYTYDVNGFYRYISIDP